MLVIILHLICKYNEIVVGMLHVIRREIVKYREYIYNLDTDLYDIINKHNKKKTRKKKKKTLFNARQVYRWYVIISIII